MNNILMCSLIMTFAPIIIFCLFITMIYIYFTAAFNFWNKLGVPFKKPTTVAGHFGDLLFCRKSQCEIMHEMYNWFKNQRYFGIFRVRTPIFIVRDPDLVKRICVKDFHYFINRGIPSNTHEILSRHLFNLEDKQWKSLRAKLTPVFSSYKIKRMFYLLIECHRILEEVINNTAINNSTIDVNELAKKFTVDVIGSCAFGIQINVLNDENSVFHRIVKKMSRPSYKIALWRMLRVSLPKIYNLLGIQLIDPEVTKFFTDIVLQLVTNREREKKNQRKDFLDLLIQLKNNENELNYNEKNIPNEKINKIIHDISLDENMIAAQAFGFFVSGYEPSSNTIAFCLYELAINTEIQRKTREDILKALNNNGGNLTYEVLREMTYLEAVVYETLRKYPPAPMTSRRCEIPYNIPGTNVILPIGMRIVIPIYGIHHDPNYYEDPDQFYPDRFFEKNNTIKHSYTFLPFGEGPRSCIGITFAITQIKLGIVSFLKRHEVIVSDKTVMPIKLSRCSNVTSSENGIWLKINLI